MKNKFTKKDNWRRYRLHERIKKAYRVDTINRQVFVKQSQIREAENDNRIKELITRFGYNVQTEIN